MIRLDLQERLRKSVNRAMHFQAREKQQVIYSQLDQSFLEHLTERWPRWHQLQAAGSAQIPTFPELLRDLFFGLYIYNPRYRGADEILPSHHGNLTLMQMSQGLPVWAAAREHAALNQVHSMLGLVSIAGTLLDELPDETKEQMRQATEGQPPQDQALQELLQQAMQLLAEQPDPSPNDGQEPDPGQTPGDVGHVAGSTPGSGDMTQAQALAQALEEALAQAEREQSIDDDTARRLMRRGLQKANNEMEQFSSMMQQWGVEPGELQQLPPERVLELYERMRKLPNIQQFTDELGRQRQEALEASKQLYAQEAQEIVDVVPSRNLAAMLPSERLALLDPELEMIFWAKYAQNALLTWAYQGREQAAKGPFILCLDVSGSTMGAPERWGKAFALASIDLASRQGRDVAILFFDATVKPEGVFALPRGRADLATKIQIASYFTGGGTNFQIPLRIAIENIEARELTWQEADIVFVTDGQYTTPPDFVADYKARAQARGVRTHGVLLDGHERMLASLELFCDRAVTIQSLTDSPRQLLNDIV